MTRSPTEGDPRPLLLAAATLAAARALTTLSPDRHAHWRIGGRRVGSLCPIRKLTGHRCPGCGMTRACSLAAHGHPIRATRTNPLIWVLAGCAAYATRTSRSPSA